jgi:glycosyltransferase involved in cell wall biosynthesis
MQGLTGQIAKVSCLTLTERLACIGIKELLKCRIVRSQRDFARWGPREEEMMRGHRFVNWHSRWAVSHVKAVNPGLRLFKTECCLREPFYRAEEWRAPGGANLFCIATSSPLKGLHVAVRALAVLRRRVPDARLRVAGSIKLAGIRQEGYIRWVKRMIRKEGLVDAVEWLGPLSAEQIIVELQNAAAMVIPTFIESYCVAFAEAMKIGTPTVVAYTGGTGYLGRDEETCLFFPPGDEAMCAFQLERVLHDREFALRLSTEARSVAASRHDPNIIVQNQIETYRAIVGGTNSN